MIEPIEHYAQVSALLTELSMLKGHCNFIGQGLLLEDLSEISEVDLVIELNVLHLHHQHCFHHNLHLHQRGLQFGAYSMPHKKRL